jgi:hypothetical protein
MKFDGRPLRQSWALPFFSRPTSLSPSADTFYCLYEAQVSVAITGIDHWVWTAYGIVDSYFGSRESFNAYHQMTSRSNASRPDPLADGRISTNNTIWTPREYFFEVLDVRIIEVRRQWNAILGKIEDEINQYVFFLHFASNNPDLALYFPPSSFGILLAFWWV